MGLFFTSVRAPVAEKCALMQSKGVVLQSNILIAAFPAQKYEKRAFFFCL